MRATILYLANHWTEFEMLLTPLRFLYLVMFSLLAFPSIPQSIAHFWQIGSFLCIVLPFSNSYRNESCRWNGPEHIDIKEFQTDFASKIFNESASPGEADRRDIFFRRKFLRSSWRYCTASRIPNPRQGNGIAVSRSSFDLQTSLFNQRCLFW